MAERRMFSKRIINSARFLKMPSSTQALYFHLGLNADDDGVVEAYTIMNSISATEDDLRILCAKELVTVLNDDMVTYINDWRENNRIRADRKVDSFYKDLLLQIVPNAEIQQRKPRADQKKELDGPWTDNGRHRIGKDSIGQYRLGEDRLVKDRTTIIDVVHFYENNGFGTISSKTREDLSYWINDFEVIGATESDACKLIIYAMGIAVEQNVRKYAYFNSILKDWEQNKLLTINDVQAKQNQRNQKENSQDNENYEGW